MLTLLHINAASCGSMDSIGTGAHGNKVSAPQAHDTAPTAKGSKTRQPGVDYGTITPVPHKAHPPAHHVTCRYHRSPSHRIDHLFRHVSVA
jgi:hypothetical protein